MVSGRRDQPQHDPGLSQHQGSSGRASRRIWHSTTSPRKCTISRTCSPRWLCIARQARAPTRVRLLSATQRSARALADRVPRHAKEAPDHGGRWRPSSRVRRLELFRSRQRRHLWQYGQGLHDVGNTLNDHVNVQRGEPGVVGRRGEWGRTPSRGHPHRLAGGCYLGPLGSRTPSGAAAVRAPWATTMSFTNFAWSNRTFTWSRVELRLMVDGAASGDA